MLLDLMFKELTLKRNNIERFLNLHQLNIKKTAEKVAVGVKFIVVRCFVPQHG